MLELIERNSNQKEDSLLSSLGEKKKKGRRWPMSKRNVFGGAAVRDLRDIDLRDDFELDDFEDDEEISVHDIDGVLGYTVDIFSIGFPYLFLVALFVGLIGVAGVYLV